MKTWGVEKEPKILKSQYPPKKHVCKNNNFCQKTEKLLPYQTKLLAPFARIEKEGFLLRWLSSGWLVPTIIQPLFHGLRKSLEI